MSEREKGKGTERMCARQSKGERVRVDKKSSS